MRYPLLFQSHRHIEWNEVKLVLEPRFAIIRFLILIRELSISRVINNIYRSHRSLGCEKLQWSKTSANSFTFQLTASLLLISSRLPAIFAFWCEIPRANAPLKNYLKCLRYISLWQFMGANYHLNLSQKANAKCEEIVKKTSPTRWVDGLSVEIFGSNIEISEAK